MHLNTHYSVTIILNIVISVDVDSLCVAHTSGQALGHDTSRAIELDATLMANIGSSDNAITFALNWKVINETTREWECILVSDVLRFAVFHKYESVSVNRKFKN